MLAKLLGFGAKRAVAVATGTLAQDDVLQARIRTFVKTNLPAPRGPRLVEVSEWAFIPPVKPTRVAQTSGDPPLPPATNESGAEKLPPLNTIYLTPEAVASDDPSAVIQVITDINNYLMQQAGHTAAEIPEAAMQAFAVDYYRTQVLNGGHGQFIGNAWHQPVTLDMCRSGLEAMDAGPYIQLWEQMHHLMAQDAKRTEAVRAGSGFGETGPIIEALDEKFFALNSKMPLQDIISPWLKGQANVVVLPEEEIEKIIVARSQHPALVARIATIEADRLEKQANDPMIQLARKLCLAVGLEWQAWTTVAPVQEMDGQQYENVWSLQTDKGIAFMAAFTPGKAALFRLKGDAAGGHDPDEMFAEPEYERMIVLSAAANLPWAAR